MLAGTAEDPAEDPRLVPPIEGFGDLDEHEAAMADAEWEAGEARDAALDARLAGTLAPFREAGWVRGRLEGAAAEAGRTERVRRPDPRRPSSLAGSEGAASGAEDGASEAGGAPASDGSLAVDGICV